MLTRWEVKAPTLCRKHFTWLSRASECSSSSKAGEKSSLSSNDLSLAAGAYLLPGRLPWLPVLPTGASTVPFLSSFTTPRWGSAAFLLHTQLSSPLYLHLSSLVYCSQAETWSEKERNLNLQYTTDFPPRAVFTAEPAPHLQYATKTVLWCEIWLGIVSVVLLN